MNNSTVTVHPNLVYGQRADKQLTLDHYQPAHPTGASVLFVNSGGFESGKLIQYEEVDPGVYRFLETDELTIAGSDPIPMLAQFSFQRLLKAGFTVFDVRHSNAPATFDLMLDDIRSAISHIHENAGEFGIDSDRIGIFGASSGGFLAIASGLTAMAHQRRLIRAIVTYYPAGFDFSADVEAFPQILEGLPALDVSDAIMQANSIKNLYQSGGPPTLVIYGDQDFPFILNPCRSICTEFPKAGIDTKCVVIKGAAHEFMREDGYRLEDGERAQEELVQWFQQQPTK
jgi:acetyl esterase/lipase